MITEADLKNESLDETTKKAVVDACHGAWLLLQSFGDAFADENRYPDVKSLITRRIINAARMGMRDTVELQREALRYVREDLAQEWPKGN